MLCTLLTEERLSPAPCAWLAMLGTPEKKGSWFRKGAGIPGMWPPWGTAWVGLLRQGEDLGFN